MGELLFFLVGSSYAFGLWYGLVVSLAMNFLLVFRTGEILESGDKDAKISWRVSFLALVRFVIYGSALAITVLTEWLSFFSTAGGLVLPVLALQLVTAVKNARFGG